MGWVVSTIYFIDDAVQVTTNTAGIQLVDQQLRDGLSTVLLPAGPADGEVSSSSPPATCFQIVITSDPFYS